MEHLWWAAADFWHLNTPPFNNEGLLLHPRLFWHTALNSRVIILQFLKGWKLISYFVAILHM